MRIMKKRRKDKNSKHESTEVKNEIIEDEDIDEETLLCIAEYERAKKSDELVTRPIEELWKELGI